MTTAFHNDPVLAEEVRKQIAAHTAADEIIQGQYWENGKGCFIGCIAHSDDPEIVEQMTGFPIMLTRIAESIFEGLPNDKAKEFPQRVINAPRIGASLDLVAWQFLHWTVETALNEQGTPAVRAACAPALEVLAMKARGEAVERDAADAADAAAYAAADVAYTVAYAAADAAYAVADVADAAADAAADVAYAAADVADAAAARTRQADKLIELLTNA